MTYQEYWNQENPARLSSFRVEVPTDMYVIIGDVVRIKQPNGDLLSAYYVSPTGGLYVRIKHSHGAYYQASVFRVDPKVLKEKEFEFLNRGLLEDVIKY